MYPLVDIQLEGDPFPVTVRLEQIALDKDSESAVTSNKSVRNGSGADKKGTKHPMPVSQAKELRKRAQALGIAGWESMGRKELAKAVAKAEANGKTPKTSKTEKAKSKNGKRPVSARTEKTERKASKPKAETTKPKTKASAPKVSETSATDGITIAKSSPVKATGENPFRKSSNLHVAANLLLKGGGRRRALAEKLQAKVKLHPYQKEDSEVDLLDFDKRLILCAQTLRDKHGYGMQKTGRGLEGTLKVFIPGSAGDPRNSTNGKVKRQTGKKAAKAR